MKKQNRKIKPQKPQPQTWDDYNEEDKIDSPVKLLKFIDWVFNLAKIIRIAAKKEVFWQKYYERASVYAAELHQANPKLSDLPNPTLDNTENLRAIRTWCLNPYERSETAEVEWSQPLGLTQIAAIFDVHSNTMRGWLRKQTIRNDHLSDRRWRIALCEFPANLVKKARNST